MPLVSVTLLGTYQATKLATANPTTNPTFSYQARTVEPDCFLIFSPTGMLRRVLVAAALASLAGDTQCAPQCTAVLPSSRQDCGHPAITKDGCLNNKVGFVLWAP